MTRSSRRRRGRPAAAPGTAGKGGTGSDARAGATTGGATGGSKGASAGVVTPAGSSRAEWGALALVLAGAAWLHRGAISFGFFADDFLFLDQVRQKSLIAALLSRDPLGNFLRPLSRQLHFWLAARVAGESPVPFHVANLAYFLVALVLFERVTRRLIGPAAAVFATAIVALSFTADVPVLWASGSQDLMAMALALAALLLFQRGNRVASAALYLLALFSKETVLLTPAVAWLLDGEKSAGRRLRNLAPLALATALWAGVWVATRSLRPAAAATMHADPRFVPAALLHLIQSAFALEWGAVSLREAWRIPELFTLVAVLLALPLVRMAGDAGEAGDGRRRALIAGIGWAVCGALPVAAVAPIWSAYYYLFAMCGVALAAGALLRPAKVAARAELLAVVAVLNARASLRPEFATAEGAWTAQSHVTRFYLERSGRIRGQLLDDLHRELPAPAHNTTIYFASVPSNIGLQAGDGPLVRWAYRDTSLRSYFMNQFSYEKARRGPSLFFMIANDHLLQLWKGEVPYPGLALNMVLDDHPSNALDAMRILEETRGLERFERYLTAWLQVDVGRVDSARTLLVQMGNGVAGGPAPETASALAMVSARGDTMRAIALLSEGLRKHPFDWAAHGLLSDLLMIQHMMLPTGQIEAYAARVVAPQVPWNWRRWAAVQLAANRSRQAALSLDRYFELAGDAANQDAEARYWRDQLKRILPGGDLAQKALRGTPEATGPFVPPEAGKP